MPQYTKSIPWISDHNGVASVKVEIDSPASLLSIQVVPGHKGDRITNIPTNNYSLRLTDKYDEDILLNRLVFLSPEYAESFYCEPTLPLFDTTELTLEIFNLEGVKEGLVKLSFFTTTASFFGSLCSLFLFRELDLLEVLNLISN